jgi:hypothetical protein
MLNKQTLDNVVVNKMILNILADYPWVNQDKNIEA